MSEEQDMTQADWGRIIGQRIVSLEGNPDADDGILIVLENGDVWHIGYSSDFGSMFLEKKRTSPNES